MDSLWAGPLRDSRSSFAKAAGGQEHAALFNALSPQPAPAAAAAQHQTQAPHRSQWHVELVKNFDNLYFVGQTIVLCLGVTASNGIVVFDTIWPYSVEDEIVGGLSKLGFDPKSIKYAVVSQRLVRAGKW